MAGSAVSQSVDEEVAELLFATQDITEGDVTTELGAEGGPVSEDLGVGQARLRGGGIGGELERSAEISGELIGAGR